MEQIKRQLTITDKLKRYTIYPLMAMGVIWGGLSSYTQADELDGQQIEQMLKVKVIGKLSQADKAEAFKAFKEEAKAAKFPEKFIELVSLETISDHELIRDRRLMYCNNGIYITLGKNKESSQFSYPAINRYKITPEDIAEPLPPLSNGINTVTKKPYFTLPKAVATKVSDKEYFKTLLKVMNTNFGSLMQLYTLDEKKVAENKYAGKVGDTAGLYFGETPLLEEGMSETEIALRRQLGFVVNGAVDMIKAGGELSIGAADCTGWTVHSIDKKDNDTSVFVVFNGARNVSGSIPYYRRQIICNKAPLLKKFRENFHTLMREKGVEPGTAIKDPSLTSDDQRAYAYIGNIVDNYWVALLKAKTLSNNGPAEKNPDLKSLDKYVGTENSTPVKTTAKTANKVSTQRNPDKRTSKTLRERRERGGR